MGQGLKLQGPSGINEAPPSCEEAYASLHRLANAFRDKDKVNGIANSTNGHAMETLVPGGQGPVVIKFTGPYGVLHVGDLADESSAAVDRQCGGLSGMPQVVVSLTNGGEVPYLFRPFKFRD